MNLICLSALLALTVNCFSEQDYFGENKKPTGLIGNLYDLKNDPEMEATDVAPNGKVDAREFYDVLERLVRKGFRGKELDKFRIGDEVCHFEYMAIRKAAADLAPTAFGSSYIDPKGIIILYEGTLKEAPAEELRFAGYFDDAVMVLVNGKLVFYSAWQDLNRLKPDAVSNGRKKEENNSADAYGDYVKLKKGDKIQVAFAEVPGGSILGALKVQLKDHEYSLDGKEDPILHPFIARKADNELVEEIKSSGIKFELKDIPEFSFEQMEQDQESEWSGRTTTEMKKQLIFFICSLGCSVAIADQLPPTKVSFTKLQLHPLYISEGASIGDLNNDGAPDVIAGSLWWEGPHFKKVH